LPISPDGVSPFFSRCSPRSSARSHSLALLTEILESFGRANAINAREYSGRTGAEGRKDSIRTGIAPAPIAWKTPLYSRSGESGVLHWLILAMTAVCKPEARLVAENLCPRQQLVVLKRRQKRSSLRDPDRRFWVMASRCFAGRRETSLIVQPETCRVRIRNRTTTRHSLRVVYRKSPREDFATLVWVLVSAYVPTVSAALVDT
jgi:hypothetical protein